VSSLSAGVLRVLRERQGFERPEVIARLLEVPPSDVMDALCTLEDRGLVAPVNYRLTDEGRQATTIKRRTA
jgi:Mn-dependent DtxR family transcriptional regulator